MELRIVTAIAMKLHIVAALTAMVGVLLLPISGHQPQAQAEERVTIGGLMGGILMDQDLALGGAKPESVDDSFAFGTRVGVQLSPRLRIEGELVIAPSQSRVSEDDLTLFVWRSHLLLDLLPSEPLRPFITMGAGFLTLSPSQPKPLVEDTAPTLHVGVGFELDVDVSMALRVDLRTALAPAVDSSVAINLELFAGATFYFPDGIAKLPPDRDHDGVFDDVDQCKSAAEDQDGFDDEDGCPDPDNDHDGILDEDDLCPADAETFNALDDEDGCPDDLTNLR